MFSCSSQDAAKVDQARAVEAKRLKGGPGGRRQANDQRGAFSPLKVVAPWMLTGMKQWGFLTRDGIKRRFWALVSLSVMSGEQAHHLIKRSVALVGQLNQRFESAGVVLLPLSGQRQQLLVLFSVLAQVLGLVLLEVALVGSGIDRLLNQRQQPGLARLRAPLAPQAVDVFDKSIQIFRGEPGNGVEQLLEGNVGLEFNDRHGSPLSSLALSLSPTLWLVQEGRDAFLEKRPRATAASPGTTDAGELVRRGAKDAGIPNVRSPMAYAEIVISVQMEIVTRRLAPRG